MAHRLNPAEEIFVFALMTAKFFFFLGLAYCPPDIVRDHMQPLRSEVESDLEQGCKHKIPQVRTMYTSVKTGITDYFAMVDRYVAGQLDQAELLAVGEKLQKISLKR